MKTSLVTGGCGFIGSHIVDKLVKMGHNVRVIDDLSASENSEFYYNEKAKYWKKDISKDDCSSVFDGANWVFHLAARSRIQPTVKSPSECFEVNVVGTQRVLEWSRNAGADRFVYSSTSSLYGHQNSIPFNPNMPADCLNPYSMSKWMGEQICKLYAQIYNFNSITLRYFNVYGPREPLRGPYAPVVGLFKRQKNAGLPMTIVGDGSQKRDFTYIDDVVSANILSAESNILGNRVYNIGTGESISINELARLVGGNVTYIEKRPAEVYETLADIRLTEKELNWSPEYSIKEKIDEY